MALQLSYNLCVINGCTQLRFTDNTGFYSTINTTGWGTPNVDITDATEATLSITTPGSTTYTIDLYDTTLFPTDIVGTEYDIPLSDIGIPTSITDGQWIFIYTVVVDDTTYTRTIYKYFYCNSECCVTTMLANIDSCDCCSNSTYSEDYLLASQQLESLKKASACGDSSNFAAIKKIIDKLCLNNGCESCK